MILSLDTSTKICSVALHDDGHLLAEKNFHLDKSHSSLLPQILGDLLNYCGMSKSQLKAIALSNGPGSYTGLRIGTSTAKGLCYALGIPLISVDTLLAMAKEANKYNLQESLLVPMLDARRMEVYAMVVNPQMEVVKETHAHVLSEDSFKEFQNKPMICFGNGAEKSKSLFSDRINFAWFEHIYTYARSIGEIAYEKFKHQQFEDLAYYEPYYLKEFKAIKPKSLI